MSYHRVIPRDLFNEANLLKCLGKVVTMIQDDKIPGLQVCEGQDEDGINEGFKIEQDPTDGSISVDTTCLSFHDGRGNEVHFRTGLNSKEPWPLVMDYRGSEYYPLNSKGEWQCSNKLLTGGRIDG